MALTATILDEEVPRARVAVLLKHFSQLGDDREPWRVMYPLKEVMLLVTCATIASCDDFDDMCAWGRHHLDFLRGFSEFHHGIPCERWLRKLVNRVNPVRSTDVFDDHRSPKRTPHSLGEQSADHIHWGAGRI